MNDFDYLDKLSPEEKQFLNTFCEGWHNADFRSKRVKELFKTQKERRDCYNKNNARNRCMYTRAKAANNVVDDEIVDSDGNVMKKEATIELSDELTPDEQEELRISQMIKDID